MKFAIIGAGLLLGIELSKRLAERQPEMEVVVILPPEPEPTPEIQPRHVAYLAHEIGLCCHHYDLNRDILALREVYPDYQPSPSPEILLLTMREKLVGFEEDLFALMRYTPEATSRNPKQRTSSASFDNDGWPAPCWYGATQRAVHS